MAHTGTWTEPPLLVDPSPAVSSQRHPWRARPFRLALGCAVRGLTEAWRTQRNLRFHAYAGAAVIAAGAWLRLALVEWLWISFAIGLVIFAELVNTAIEQTVDLAVGLSPDPQARHIKDLAAGCVLIASAIAVVIGVLTLGPKMGPGLFFSGQR